MWLLLASSSSLSAYMDFISIFFVIVCLYGFLFIFSQRKGVDETGADMTNGKKVDEELNRPIPRRLSSSRKSNSFDALDEPIQKNVKARVQKRPVPMMAAPDSCDYFDAVELLNPILVNVVQALDDPNNHLVGVYGSKVAIEDALLGKLRNRITGNQFDLVLTVTVTKKPSVTKIQEEIAQKLGLTFNDRKDKAERARQLTERIKRDQRKILIVLRDIYKNFDLGKVGIPYGAGHRRCKILLTSTAEDVLSNHMHTQRTIRLY